MIKPSEFTPRSSELMARMFASAFDESEVAVCTGGPEVGAAFSRLPFDHLLFTARTSIAYHVMKAAAENLVPTTLELGGKSPVIVGDSADLALTAKRVMFGKTMNAGQICLAPDYVLVPQDKSREFVKQAADAVSTMFPTLKDNPDYTSVITSAITTACRAISPMRGPRAPRSWSSIRQGGFPPAALSQDSADPGAQPDRRHEDHAGRDLRAAAAGEDLQQCR